MSNKKDPNKRHYFQSVGAEEFAEAMAQLCSQSSVRPVTLWEKGESEDQAETFNLESYDPKTKTITLKANGKLLTKITGSSKTGKSVLIKIPIEDKIHYFSGGRLDFHALTLSYSLQITQDFFKSQQRGKYRLNSSSLVPIQFKIDDQVFDALDLSTGGTSVAIKESEVERFPKGKLFRECTLRFDRKNYYIPQALIVAHNPILDSSGNPTDQIRIGISFQDLPSKTEDELYVKISTEARGEEMKQKFDSIMNKKP